jgi:hypothetical protein
MDNYKHTLIVAISTIGWQLLHARGKIETLHTFSPHSVVIGKLYPSCPMPLLATPAIKIARIAWTISEPMISEIIDFSKVRKIFAQA